MSRRLLDTYMRDIYWKYGAIGGLILCIIVITTFFWFPGGVFAPNLDDLVTDVFVTTDHVSEESVVSIDESVRRVTFAAVGDIMLDRTMLLLARKHNDFGYAFRMISSTLTGIDVRVANLEGPITTNTSISNGTGGARFSFTFSPQVTSSLKHNFDIVSLANNHTSNFGFEGLEQTKRFLDDAGIAWFGDPNNRGDHKLGEMIEKNGITIGFVGYHQLVQKGFENVIAEIQRLRPLVDVLIAYPHWGVEYVTDTPSKLQIVEAHDMIDMGVDMVIGAHPHVIQPFELYRGKPIFYSLGNFVFDQYFSRQTMQGLILKGEFEKHVSSSRLFIRLELVPVHINTQSQPFVADDDERIEILEALARVSLVDEEFKNMIQKGYLEFELPLTSMK